MAPHITSQIAGPKRWVISLHGINTRGLWQNDFAEECQQFGLGHSKFDYGDLWKWHGLDLILSRKAREASLQWFRERYENLKTVIGESDPPHLVAHSYGTWLAAHALLKFPELRLGKVVFTGSVLTPDFQWGTLLGRGQIERLLNEKGSLDTWPKVATRMSKAFGRAGVVGFELSSPIVCSSVANEDNAFQHSDSFYRSRFKEKWLPFMLEDIASNRGTLASAPIIGDDLHLPTQPRAEPLIHPDTSLSRVLIEMLYHNAPQQESLQITQASLWSRVDAKGNYYGHYSVTGQASPTGAPPTKLSVPVSGDSREGRIVAVDAEGKRLQVEHASAGDRKSVYQVHFRKPLERNEQFQCRWFLDFPSSINLMNGDADYLRCFHTGGTQSLSIAQNFPVRLKNPSIVLIHEQQIRAHLEIETVEESDGSITYRAKSDNVQCDALLFRFDGAQDSEPALGNRRLDPRQTLLPDGSQIQLSMLSEREVKRVYDIEVEVEQREAANEEVLLQRFKMFPEGFRVAKVEGTIKGYIECLIWHGFQFSTFDDIRKSPLFFRPDGNSLYVIFLCVAADMRERGVGGALLEEATRLAAAFHLSKIELVAKREYRSFYEKRGFRCIRELPDFLCGISGMLMQKDI